MIYALQPDGGGPIKIGFTTLVAAVRVAQIQKHWPIELKLLGVMEGDRQMEGFIHNQLADSRLRGEWFSLTDQVAYFLAQEGFRGWVKRPDLAYELGAKAQSQGMAAYDLEKAAKRLRKEVDGIASELEARAEAGYRAMQTMETECELT